MSPISFLSLKSIFIFTTFVLETRPASESKNTWERVWFCSVLHKPDHPTGSCFVNFELLFKRYSFVCTEKQTSAKYKEELCTDERDRLKKY